MTSRGSGMVMSFPMDRSGGRKCFFPGQWARTEEWGTIPFPELPWDSIDQILWHLEHAKEGRENKDLSWAGWACCLWSFARGPGTFKLFKVSGNDRIQFLQIFRAKHVCLPFQGLNSRSLQSHYRVLVPSSAREAAVGRGQGSSGCFHWAPQLSLPLQCLCLCQRAPEKRQRTARQQAVREKLWETALGAAKAENETGKEGLGQILVSPQCCEEGECEQPTHHRCNATT